MPDEIRDADARIEHATVRHEPTDADLRWIGGMVAGAAIVCVLLFYLVLLFFHQCSDSLAEQRKSRFPLANEAGKLPPEPRLEQLDRMTLNPSVNGYGRQWAKLEILYSYGDTAEPGFIHVPIDKAMALLANKLPARSRSQTVNAMMATEIWGLLGASQNPLFAVSASGLGNQRLLQAFVEGRHNGLVDGGAPNSGRLFNQRKPSWLGN
jgi:hypothetical protein